MNKYKSEFIVKFGNLMEKNLPVWQEFQKMYRKKLYTSDLGTYFVAFAVGFIPGKRETDYFNNFSSMPVRRNIQEGINKTEF